MDEELVSILIPVYNRVSIVGETIESAINQTYKNIEIIIVDNCSTDGTWELLQNYAKKDSRIRIFRNTENIGPVRNWKRCVDEAKGKYSKILFSDDLISSNYVEECICDFDNKTGFVMSDIETIFEDKTVSKVKYNNIYTQHQYLYNALIQNNEIFSVSPGNAIFRTKDLNSAISVDIINPFGWNYSKSGAGNDLLIMCSIALNYELIKVNSNSTATYRGHANSITSMKSTDDIQNLYGYAKIFFVNNYIPTLGNDLKTKIIYKGILNYQKCNFYKEIKGNFSFISLLRILFSKINKKFNTYEKSILMKNQYL